MSSLTTRRQDRVRRYFRVPDTRAPWPILVPGRASGTPCQEAINLFTLLRLASYNHIALSIFLETAVLYAVLYQVLFKDTGG